VRDQIELLTTESPDVLIVLDACRADAFRGVCSARAETVRSPARRTDRWLHQLGPLLRRRRAVYFTANPLVKSCTGRWREITRVDVWETHWGRFSELQLPSVHPLVVNGVVGAWRDLGKLADRPVVVHYLQPHSPFIGAVPYALTYLRWGCKGCRMTQELCKVSLWPNTAEIDWELLRRAYRANLELVWDAARRLADSFAAAGRRVVITSDHGELLGETKDGAPEGEPRFGHQPAYANPLLHEVPWLVWEYAPKQPTTTDKLEALGYA